MSLPQPAKDVEKEKEKEKDLKDKKGGKKGAGKEEEKDAGVEVPVEIDVERWRQRVQVHVKRSVVGVLSTLGTRVAEREEGAWGPGRGRVTWHSPGATAALIAHARACSLRRPGLGAGLARGSGRAADGAGSRVCRGHGMGAVPTHVHQGERGRHARLAGGCSVREMLLTLPRLRLTAAEAVDARGLLWAA